MNVTSMKFIRERQTLYIITYIWNLNMKYTSEFNKKEAGPVDIENKLVVTSGKGERVRGKIGVGN